jgi:hypothetical protein
MTDINLPAIQALAAAAASPIPPPAWGIASWEERLAAAARNGVPELFRLVGEMRKYCGHQDDCLATCILNPGMVPPKWGECGCGYSALTALLEKI